MTDPGPRSTPHLVSRARAFLAQGEPASAELIAREVLGIHGATPALASRLVSSLLDGVAGFTRERGDSWRLSSQNPAMSESGVTRARSDLLVAGGSAGRDPAGAIDLIDLAAGEFRAGIGAAAIASFRVRLGAGSVRPRNDIGGAADDDLDMDPVDDMSSLARFASCVAGAAVAAYRPREILDPIMDQLLATHGVCLELDSISLARLARRLAPDVTHHTLEELAAGLGLSHYTSARGEDQARLAGLVLAALLARAEFAGPVTAEALLALEDDAIGPRDFERFAFDEGWLAELPETPGIYRMFDAAGELIYVGKAASLRRRLFQYFRNSGTRDERVERILAALHRIEIEETGSELAALLAEEREIRERAPRLNVQRDVLPRPYRPSRARNLALITSGALRETAVAFFYQPPHPVGRVEFPLAGSLDAATRGMIIDFLARESGPDARMESSAAGRGGLEIVRSWIHLRRDESIVVDLEAASHHEDAIRRIEEARSSLLDRDAVEHR